MRFHILIMRHEDKTVRFHVQAFHEVVESLAYGLSALGHDVSFKSNVFLPEAQNIVLGAQFADPKTEFPAGTVLYNLEQLGGNDLHLISPDLIRRYHIWDYSPANLPFWKQRGIDPQVVQLGYVPQLTRIKPEPFQPIDVLFYGAISPRRKSVIKEILEIPNLKFHWGVGFGKERDPLIAQSKVVLNVHYYDKPQLFEQVRCAYLFANRKCVVSEESEDYPPALAGACRVVPYDQLSQACHELVKNVDERLRYQQRGYELFSKQREQDILRPVVKELALRNSHSFSTAPNAAPDGLSGIANR